MTLEHRYTFHSGSFYIPRRLEPENLLDDFPKQTASRFEILHGDLRISPLKIIEIVSGA